MTQRLRDAIDAATQPGSRAGGPVQVDCGDLHAQIDVVDAGPVGVSVERLKLSGPKGDVARRAEALSRTLHPAGERVVPIEVAPRLGGARLRSHPEHMQRGRFYEVEVQPDSIEISRQRVGPDGQRTPERFDLTREQLGDVADALEGAFQRPAAS